MQIVLLLISTYTALCLLFYLGQHRLIFSPETSAQPLRPEDWELTDVARHVEIVAEDGVKLRGWRLSPELETSEKRDALNAADRALVYFGGNAGHRGRNAQRLRYYARRGFHVFCFDYRGYGDNDGSPSEKGLYADATAVWNHVRGLGLPAERIALIGFSLGSAVAVHLAGEFSRAGEPPGALVLECGFTTAADAGARLYPFFPIRLLLRVKFDALSYLAAVSCPIMVMHGALDRVIPLVMGRKLFAAAPETAGTGPATGMPKCFVELPHSAHGDLLASDETVYSLALMDFLQTAIPPQPSAARKETAK